MRGVFVIFVGGSVYCYWVCFSSGMHAIVRCDGGEAIISSWRHAIHTRCLLLSRAIGIVGFRCNTMILQVLCQNQISKTGIPQYLLWDVIICVCPWYLLLVQYFWLRKRWRQSYHTLNWRNIPHNSPLEFRNAIPFFALAGGLLGGCCVYLGRNWPCCKTSTR